MEIHEFLYYLSKGLYKGDVSKSKVRLNPDICVYKLILQVWESNAEREDACMRMGMNESRRK